MGEEARKGAVPDWTGLRVFEVEGIGDGVGAKRSLDPILGVALGVLGALSSKKAVDRVGEGGAEPNDELGLASSCTGLLVIGLNGSLLFILGLTAAA